MLTFKKYFLAMILGGAAATAMAEGNPLSVHVLNLQNGLPSSSVKVTLEKQNENKWELLSEKVTNEQGRIQDLYPVDEQMKNGVYRVTFKTGEWFEERNIETFFPEVPVIFLVDGSLPKYHIPLLISPYGFSTYRGN